MGRYRPEKLADGWNRTADGEEFFVMHAGHEHPVHVILNAP